MTDADSGGQRPPEPYRRHQFVVHADGLPVSGFAEIRGLDVSLPDRTVEPTADRDERRFSGPGFLNRVVGRRRSRERRETISPPLELWRGVTDELVLWNWLRDWVDGTIEPRRVGVYLLDGADVPAVGWVCEDATPLAWSGPTLAAESPGVAMEKLELEHEGLSATTDVPSDVVEGLSATDRLDVDDVARRLDSHGPDVGDFE